MLMISGVIIGEVRKLVQSKLPSRIRIADALLVNASSRRMSVFCYGEVVPRGRIALRTGTSLFHGIGVDAFPRNMSFLCQAAVCRQTDSYRHRVDDRFRQVAQPAQIGITTILPAISRNRVLRASAGTDFAS